MNKTVNGSDACAGRMPYSQPARERNVEELVAFFRSGIKEPGSTGRLGIELEHIVVHDDMSPVAYSADDGVALLLSELAERYPEVTSDAEGDILGVARPGAAVTIEPAAQLELSAGPFSDLETARKTFQDFDDAVSDLLRTRGERLLAVGYHPTAKARELELIPKVRYEYMNRYLGAKDVYGPCMMRGSASTQVSIDYTSEEDCLRKLRLAYAAVPLLSLMTDNAPTFEGEMRPHKLVRTDIWNHVDNDRCGLIPGALDRTFTLRALAEHVLDTPAILVPDGQDGWRYAEETFGELYATRPMTRAEAEHATSMFFPDVRLKTYIEIRPADSMPVPYVIAYAALVKGLFYDPENLDALETLFDGVDEQAYDAAKDALMERGYAASVYGRDAGELCDELVRLARRGLPAHDHVYLEPLAHLVRERETLADRSEREA